MKKLLFGFKYPKLFLLIIAIVLAYIIFRNPSVSNFVASLGHLSYLGVFIAGIFLAFGFSAPFAVGFFIILNPENILLTVIIGAIGSMIADLIIFRFIRMSFMEEFKRLEKTKLARGIEHVIDWEFGHIIKSYLMYAFIGLLIASPLPDEAGIVMLAGLTKVKQHIVGLLCFVLHSIGIFIIINI